MSRSTPSTARTSPYCLCRPRMLTSATALAGGVKRLLQELEAAVEILVADRERREQADHVPVEAAGEEQQAALEGGRDDRRGAVRRAFGELERQHRPEPAHLADLRPRGGERIEPRPHRLAEPLGRRAEARLGNGVEDDAGGSAGD